MTGQAEGRLEAVVDGRAVGWAWDPKRPGDAVEVEVFIDDRPAAKGVADVERLVLAKAGMGDGRYGFDVALPEALGDEPTHTIRVLAGPDRDEVLPFEQFATTVRTSDTAWNRTTFVAAGLPSLRAPFIPDPEEAPDPGEAALVGKRNWLFLRDDANLTFEQLAGAPLLSPQAVELRAAALGERRRQLRDLRIPYLFAVAPLKERLYGKHLPPGLALDPASPLNQLRALLRDSNRGHALDLLPALLEGRREGQVFPRTDSNWSDRGAFFAYRDLVKEAGKSVIDLADPQLPEQARFIQRSGFRGDLADKPKLSVVDGQVLPHESDLKWEEELDVADVSALRALRMPAPEHLEVTPGRAPHLYEIPEQPTLPRAVLLGDVCCLPLIPWLAEHFSRLVFLWTVDLPLEAIELEMPDIVIHVISERRFVHER